MIVYVLLFLLSGVFCSMNAILDGRSSLIYLENRYTFTRNEWAKGSVFFTNGFDVPPGGTVYLGIDEGRIYTTVNLNGGTLALTKDLTFHNDASITGSGFIALNGHFFRHGRPYPGVFGGAPYIKFLNSGRVFATRKAAIIHTETTIMDLKTTGGLTTFIGGIIVLRDNRFLTSSSTNSIVFEDIFILHEGNTVFSFNNPSVIFSGDAIVKTHAILSFKALSTSGLNIIITPQSTIRAATFDVPFSGIVYFDNSNLDLVSTGTSPIVLGYPTALQGQIVFSGQCSLGSSTGNKIFTSPDLDIGLTSGSRLTLTPNTHLAVQ